MQIIKLLSINISEINNLSTRCSDDGQVWFIILETSQIVYMYYFRNLHRSAQIGFTSIGYFEFPKENSPTRFFFFKVLFSLRISYQPGLH